MSWFEIGIYHTKTEENVGTLWRSAYQLGASGIFTIGKRYKHQCSDTYKTPKQIPLRHYKDWHDFSIGRPLDAVLIGVEIGGEPLVTFQHPKTAVYLLGAEDGGLPKDIIAVCQYVVSIESVRMASYNVAIAGSLIMWHRLISKHQVFLRADEIERPEMDGDAIEDHIAHTITRVRGMSILALLRELNLNAPEPYTPVPLASHTFLYVDKAGNLNWTQKKNRSSSVEGSVYDIGYIGEIPPISSD